MEQVLVAYMEAEGATQAQDMEAESSQDKRNSSYHLYITHVTYMCTHIYMCNYIFIFIYR